MSIILVIVGISILIFVHELGHFLVAKKMGLLVEEFGFGFPPRLWSKKIGETTYSLNWLPFGGFVKIYGEDPAGGGKFEAPNIQAPKERSFSFQPVWKRALIVVAGVAMNFLLGWLLMSLIFMIGTPKALLISEVLPASPAESVGLLARDQIRGFDGAKQFIDFVNKNRGKEITLNVRRDSQDLVFRAVPRIKEPAALGIGLVEAGIERHSFFSSFWEGLKASATIVASILAAFWTLLAGLLSRGQLAADIVGPIGIFGVANQAGSLGLLYVVQLIAMISLNLTVLNILPFPALDGGRLLFVIIEKIKGSPLDAKFERLANAAGFALLLLLMFAITVRDLVRLF